MSTPDEQTGRPLTRRELRELRAKGVGPAEAQSPADSSAVERPSVAEGTEGAAAAASAEPETSAPATTPGEAPAPAEKAATPAHPPLTRKEMRQLRTNEVPIVSAELVSTPEDETPPLTHPEAPVSTTVFEMPTLDPAFGAGVGMSTGRESASFDALMEQAPSTSPSSILMTSSHPLPDGVGSTGAAHGTTDGRDIDAVLIDGELPAASSPTPIAASSAISTQKSAAEVLRPPAPEKGRNLLLVLGITAGALGIVAVGTLATLYFTGAFN
ncbi:MAG TPA: hypothetical protein VKZ73_08935 [Microbacterium sp.]|nr:hypothetical protein [Microbacterium sp.]